MNLDIQGKRVLITGGTRGIGRATARAFAAEACTLGLVARGAQGLEDTAAELRAAGATVHTAIADVSQAHEGALSALIEALGGVDIAVSNAGASAAGPALEAADDVWRGQWELNFLSAVRLLRACAPHFARQGGGCLTAISSISAQEAFGYPAYVSSKAPLHAFAKTAAKEGAAKNIRVNCVAPGSILFPGGSWDRRRTQEPERFAQVQREMPFGRFGTPEEVAAAVLFLSSPRASWISGTVLVVDGAQSNRF
jgi:3-oxoacyl-[acyl-carrier protein] reductase